MGIDLMKRKPADGLVKFGNQPGGGGGAAGKSTAPPSLLQHPSSLFNPDERLIPINRRGSIWFEQYEKVRLRLLNSARELQIVPKVVLVTSSLPAEGKTLTAVNLALTLQRSGQSKVVLIDADLRKPQIHKFLIRVPEQGLGEVLNGKVAIEKLLGEGREGNLRVVAAGRDVNNPIGLLESPRLSESLAKVRETYDHIIVDAPPWLPFPDAALLSEHADGVVVVVRMGTTPRDAVQKLLDALDRKKLLGVVANDVEDDGLRQYYKYYDYKS
jgi:capsular exopolysaccharide synthesis family protein